MPFREPDWHHRAARQDPMHLGLLCKVPALSWLCLASADFQQDVQHRLPLITHAGSDIPCSNIKLYIDLLWAAGEGL